MELLFTFSSTVFVAFLITFASIPSIIKVARQKHLYDEPNESRKSHKFNIPTLGGIAIFGGMIISSTFFINFTHSPELVYSTPAFILLFFTGVKDDIIPLTPIKKLLAQIIAASIVVFKCDVRFTDMYGLFWVNNISYEFSIIISIFTILVIVNSFNLIDGINGLAGGISLIVSATFGILFFMLGKYDLVVLACALSGALIGFLYYNFREHAKIFMGDTGSLIIGLAMAMFCIKFIEFNKIEANLFKPTFGPILSFAILIVPLFDTMRVFALRISKGISPFRGDRNHLHHLLINLKFNHWQASVILYIVNIFFIGFVLLFKDTPQIYPIVGVLGLTYGFSWFLVQLNQKNIKTSSLPQELVNTNKVIANPQPRLKHELISK